MNPTLAFFSLALLLITLPSSFAFKPCPPCGNLPIPPPLSTNPSCGNPSYKLSCINQTLMFQSLGGSYHKVLSIDPTSCKIIISPPYILRNSCSSSDLMEGGLQIDEKSPFNVSNRNTVMLFNCSDSLLLSPLNCSPTSVCRKLERVIDEGSACGNTLCCSYLKDSPTMSHQIRVRVGACTAYTSVVAMDESADPWAWRFGIELQWLPLV